MESPRKKLTQKILGRRVLESIGCDSRMMLEAVGQKDGCANDVDRALRREKKKEGGEGKIGAVIIECPFHNRTSANEDNVEHLEEFVELADDSPDDVFMKCSNECNTRLQRDWASSDREHWLNFLILTRVLFG